MPRLALASDIKTTDINNHNVSNDFVTMNYSAASHDKVAFYDCINTSSCNFLSNKLNSKTGEGTDLKDVCAVPDVGYKFVKWTKDNMDVSSNSVIRVCEIKNFLNKNATNDYMETTLVAHFEPRNDIPYTIRHFKQNLNGSYSCVPDEHESFTGRVGDVAKAVVKRYKGYTNFPLEEQDQQIIVADGSTVLDIYYKRNIHSVSYEILGERPDNIPEFSNSKSYYSYGRMVARAEDLNQQDYFCHWNTDASISINQNGMFSMPDQDVVFTGRWEKKPNATYIVRHFQENFDGTFSDVPNETESFTGKVQSVTKAVHKNYTGYTPCFLVSKQLLAMVLLSLTSIINATLML